MRIKVLISTLTIVLYLYGSQALSAQNFGALRFTIPDTTANEGDVLCLDFKVDNFVNVQSFQFAIRFDPLVLQPQCPINLTYLLGLNSGSFNCSGESANGIINVLWTDPNLGLQCGENIVDDSPLFTVCFDVIGSRGQSSPIFIDDNPPFEMGYDQIPDCDDTETVDSYGDIEFTPGSLTINCGNLTVSTNKCDASSGNNNGIIRFSTCGGTAPYTYSINNGQFTGNIASEREETIINDLPTGSYEIIVTDADGTMTTENISITNSQSLALDQTGIIRNPSCWSRSNGRITLNNTSISGGVPPYNIQWFDFEFNTSEKVRLRNGTYGVTIEDNVGCRIEEEITLFTDTIKVEAELIDDASCNTSDDGVVRLTATGGTPYNGVEYVFNNSVPTSVFTDNNASGGWYRYVVSDASRPVCSSAEDSIFVGTKGSNFDVDIQVTDISCFGANDGTLIVNGIGSTDFDFSLRDEDNNPPDGARSNRTTYEVFTLTPGFWFLETEERLVGCTILDTIEIAEPSPFVVTKDTLNPSCRGMDGSIAFAASGGTTMNNYTFNWSDGGNEAMRSNLDGGTYTVTVSDDNGCDTVLTTVLSADGEIMANVSINTPIGCAGTATGGLRVDVTSTGSFAYRWVSGTDTIGRNQTIANLGAGFYEVVVIDTILNCRTRDTITLNDPSSILLTANYTLPQCPSPEFMNGSIGVSPSGGSGNYTYLWQDGSTNSVLGAISAGDYSVTITDDSGCAIDSTFTLDNPDAIDVAITEIIGVNCFGTANGGATAVAAGGTVNNNRYNYFWSSGPSDTDFEVGVSMAEALPAGRQWVIATDAQCASDTLFFDVPDIEPISLDLTSTIINNPSCFGSCDGSITAVGQGGNPLSFSYQWSFDGSVSPSLVDICAGTYYVNITDANSCTNLDSIILGEPDSLVVDINQSTTIDPNCFNNGEAQIGVLASGGTPDYSYTWTDGVSTDPIAMSLSDGAYFVTVTDNNGCTDVTSYILSSPEPIQAEVGDIPRPRCFGGRTCVGVQNVTGGTGQGYTFTINRGVRFPVDSCISVFAGPYNLTVFDSDGCSTEYSIEIDQPEELSVELGDDIEVQLGETSMPINADIESVLDIVSIDWSPIDSLQCITADCQVVEITPSANGIYTITITDENGCTASDDIRVFLNKKRNVYAANIFSPNGDGFNDRFQLTIGSGVEVVNKFLVFDRWGNTVWQQQSFLPQPDASDGWDGSFRGAKSESGVYGYVAEVKFIDGETIIFKGSITLLR